MNWLVMYFALQAGMVSQTIGIGPSTWTAPPNTIEATMSAKAVVLDHIELSTFMRSWQIPANVSPFFSPFRIDYGVEAKLTLGPLSAGIRHECDHPVSSSFTGSTTTVPMGNCTEAFIRLDVEAHF